MSNRTKKSKTDQLRAATGHAKSGPHITKISADSSHRDNSKSPADAAKDGKNIAVKATTQTQNGVKSRDGDVTIKPEGELIVTETGKTEVQAVDKANAELNKPQKLSRKERKALKKSQKSDAERPLKSYFILFRPFVGFGRYLRDSWREIRQVRWPNRKATWKMTLAVLVYCALFMVFLTLLDVFFTFIFDLLFK